MKNFLNTPAGTWVKVFVAACLAFILAHGGIWDLNWKDLVSAGTMAAIPSLINFLNPADTRYGIGKVDAPPSKGDVSTPPSNGPPTN